MIDLLELIQSGKLSLEKGEEIFDETIEKMHLGKSSPIWWETLGMSRYEATAYAHGADLEGLIFLRYNGWPDSCSKCGFPIDYKQFGWRLLQNEGETPKLIHLVCPSP